MRNMFAETLYEVGCADPRVCIVVADISPAGSMEKFRQQFPERFINVGVAEQSMIGICAGLALKGLRPFAYTIATFSLYRPFEMIRDDLCYQNLPVTVVGIGGGVIYSTLGGTHHAQEDIAIASALPNMSVVCPCDAPETRDATRYLATESQGPTYLRLGKAGEPVLTGDAAEPFRPGKLRYLRKKEGAGTCVLSHGVVMKMALDVADGLEAGGESVSVVSAHTVKPLDCEGVERILENYNRVVVIEEHAPRGGLAPHVKQIAWDVRAKCDLRTFTLEDEFIHNYGSHAQLLKDHGLDAELILASL